MGKNKKAKNNKVKNEVKKDVVKEVKNNVQNKTEKKIKDGEYKTTNEVTAHQAQFQNAIRKMANTDSIIKVENGKVSFILGFTPYSHAKDFAAKSGEEVLNITKGIKDEKYLFYFL